MDTKTKAAKDGANTVDPQEQLSKAVDVFSETATQFIDANQRYLHDVQEHSREAAARILAAKNVQEACALEVSEFVARCNEFQRYTAEVSALFSQACSETGHTWQLPVPAAFNLVQMPLTGVGDGAGRIPDLNAIARSMFELAGNGMRQMAAMSGEIVKAAQAATPKGN